jgi:hypothetical protein
VIGFSFREVMEGTVSHGGAELPFRIDLRVKGPTLLRFLARWNGIASGTATLGASRSAAEGRLRISPLVEQRIGYTVSFTSPDGRPLRFEGTKHNRFFFGGWRLLRGTVYDVSGAEWGTAVLRFLFRRHLLGLLISIRLVFRKPQVAHG